MGSERWRRAAGRSAGQGRRAMERAAAPPPSRAARLSAMSPRSTNSCARAAPASAAMAAVAAEFASGPSRPFFMWAIIGLLAAWLIFTTMHRVAPEERGVVTRLGRYSHTLGPGIGFTLPAPFDRVQKIDVENIRTIDLGSATSETLMLTGDQNIIDIAYSVRWNIRDPELYLFEIAQPDETIQRSRRKRDARGDQRRDLERRDRRRARRDRNAGRRIDAERARQLSRGRADPGRRDQAGRSASRGQRSVQGSHRRAAAGPVLCQRCARLCASADRQGAGRGDRIRQGLCSNIAWRRR